ncbi:MULTISPECIES: hypothetical protein [Stappiaceae]|uniref:Uncharacterized protein n=1 Tax=Roseibium alexandrii (strain DSM 17067 / NCIMB 14079 / DFL-11) TaxID=244592 RepID=A0A5E8H7Q8_ROSAD|nr:MULTISPECIES: hypothetical protein [Stappiaceae]EEE48190.1 hypothetical protein SADFL11_84 [Roseibium alexandrii DFL-11]QFT71306.1 hypothetical protein FIU93_31235 [Labrenzia sp. THAF35]
MKPMYFVILAAILVISASGAIYVSLNLSSSLPASEKSTSEAPTLLPTTGGKEMSVDFN